MPSTSLAKCVIARCESCKKVATKDLQWKVVEQSNKSGTSRSELHCSCGSRTWQMDEMYVSEMLPEYLVIGDVKVEPSRAKVVDGKQKFNISN